MNWKTLFRIAIQMTLPGPEPELAEQFGIGDGREEWNLLNTEIVGL